MSYNIILYPNKIMDGNGFLPFIPYALAIGERLLLLVKINSRSNAFNNVLDSIRGSDQDEDIDNVENASYHRISAGEHEKTLQTKLLTTILITASTPVIYLKHPEIIVSPLVINSMIAFAGTMIHDAVLFAYHKSKFSD